MASEREIDNAYEKSYRMRVFKHNIAVSVPPEVIRREARKHNLTVEEFVDQFYLVARYNGIEGILYTFEPVGSD